MNSLAFIGGGNMASAIIGGLIQAGRPASSIWVVEPEAAQRQRLQSQFGVQAWAQALPELAQASVVVWAVKPQLFPLAASPCAPHVAQAVQLSVMAGVRCARITAATGSVRVVRAMPNTPALIGKGISGLFATEAVQPHEQQAVASVLAPTGELIWVRREADLDAVTALSGSGPAYVFYLLEAMVQAAQDMGLSPEQGRQLALQTFAGATALAKGSPEALAELRERVTSKGGTTHAALSLMQAEQLGPTLVRAIRAAQARAQELGEA
jgi:pyrroline-5-carboxylate reductase